jgi:hypothetical protein
VARGRLSPLPDPALKGAQLTIRENAGQFTLEADEEFPADTVGLSLEPRAHARPYALERIYPGPPITRGPRLAAMGGADLAVLPRRGKTLEEALEVSLVANRDVGRLPSGQPAKWCCTDRISSSSRNGSSCSATARNRCFISVLMATQARSFA